MQECLRFRVRRPIIGLVRGNYPSGRTATYHFIPKQTTFGLYVTSLKNAIGFFVFVNFFSFKVLAFLASTFFAISAPPCVSFSFAFFLFFPYFPYFFSRLCLFLAVLLSFLHAHSIVCVPVLFPFVMARRIPNCTFPGCLPYSFFLLHSFLFSASA